MLPFFMHKMGKEGFDYEKEIFELFETDSDYAACGCSLGIVSYDSFY